MSDFNLLPQIAELLQNIPDKLVTEIATQVADLAVVNCPEQTGFLASSIYVKSHILSTYGQGMLDPPGDSFAFAEVEDPGSGTAYVAVAANYAVYVELGTRKMGAEPYLIPALEQIGPAVSDGTLFADLLAGQIAGML